MISSGTNICPNYLVSDTQGTISVLTTGLMISSGTNRCPYYWDGGTLEDYQGTDYRADDILEY